ncbi:SRSO17 transposase [Bradyrhizobium sp. USDA 4508]
MVPPGSSAGPLEAWIIDDTALPETGMHPVGPAATLRSFDKQDERQVPVWLSVTNYHASLPVA